jgi:hypothetical protein
MGDREGEEGQAQLINNAVPDNRAPRNVGAGYNMLGGKINITQPPPVLLRILSIA